MSNIVDGIMIDQIKNGKLLLQDPPCIRLLCENQIRIRRFLKEELKYDLKLNVPQLTTGNDESAVVSVAQQQQQQQQPQQQNALMQNKPEGSNDCYLCERKFVHASGLIRHIEKHTMDVIPRTNTLCGGKNGALSINGNNFLSTLRAVLNCNSCGQIFFEIKAAIDHLAYHYPNESTSVREYDMRSDLQLLNNVEDSICYLQEEVK